MKIKENKKGGKYLNFARVKNKLCNMKLTVIPIVNRIVGMIRIDLARKLEELEIGERAETNKATELFRSVRILRRVLKTLKDWVWVTQTPVKDHQLTLAWKTRKKWMIIMIIINWYENHPQTGNRPWVFNYSITFLYPHRSSSSSCRAASTDIPDPLSPLFPIVHRLWQVFRSTSRILT